jgi:hypothetical protein
MQPFTLHDVYALDWRYGGHTAPPEYPWWPFRNFGLRDSNLSANFPTTAQLGMHLLAAEGGPQVDGVVALNEPVIARILGIVGPVMVPEYHQIVSEQNLEMVIRQYTENQAVLMTPGHQRFTVMLGHAFMAKLHGLPMNQLAAIAQSLLASVRPTATP